MSDDPDTGTTVSFDLSEQELKRAGRLHEKSLVIDGLVAGTYYLDHPTYRDRLGNAGLAAGNLTIGGPSFQFDSTIDSIEDITERIAENQDRYSIVRSTADIEAADEAGRTGIILGFQGANWVHDELSRIATVADLGVRVIDLAYNRGNTLGDGCCEHRDAGLTMLGRDAVATCNNLGIVLDISHCHDRTTMEVVDQSEDPVIASHIGCRALANSTARAKTDAQLRAVAENGGVNCITPFPPVIKRDPETHEVLPAHIDDVLDHIDHAVSVGGVESVAFGGDMSEKILDEESITEGSNLNVWRKTHPEVYGSGPTDRMDPYPVGLSRYSELENLTRGLVSRGYTDEEIEGILGRSLQRVFETVWE